MHLIRSMKVAEVEHTAKSSKMTSSQLYIQIGGHPTDNTFYKESTAI